MNEGFLMSKNLTAQQLADELKVTRQLIYYHAKKLPKNSKTYDEDNTLVFTPEQQEILKSYMTDTLKEKNTQKIESKLEEKNAQTSVEEKEKTEANDSETLNKTTTNKLTNDVSNELSNDETNDKSNVVKDEGANTEDVSKKNERPSEQYSEAETASYERSITVKGYINQAVKDQIEGQKLTETEERQILIGELEEKNAQINTLHKLLDQQQQLALVAEQKRQKLLETLGVDDEKELKAIVDLTTTHIGTANTTEDNSKKDLYEGKSWFQRLFKL